MNREISCRNLVLGTTRSMEAEGSSLVESVNQQTPKVRRSPLNPSLNMPIRVATNSEILLYMFTWRPFCHIYFFCNVWMNVNAICFVLMNEQTLPYDYMKSSTNMSCWLWTRCYRILNGSFSAKGQMTSCDVCSVLYWVNESFGGRFYNLWLVICVNDTDKDCQWNFKTCGDFDYRSCLVL